MESLRVLFGRIAFRKDGTLLQISIRDADTDRTHPANIGGFINNSAWPRKRFISTLSQLLQSLADPAPTVREKVIGARRLNFPLHGRMNVDESSMFYITPARPLDREVEIALETIFHAIGRQVGRRVNLAFVDICEGEPRHRPESQTIEQAAS